MEDRGCIICGAPLNSTNSRKVFCSDRCRKRYKKANGSSVSDSQGTAAKVGLWRKDDKLTVVTEPTTSTRADRSRVNQMLIDRGFNPDEWEIKSLTVNEWEGMSSAENGNQPVTLHQTKASMQAVKRFEETMLGKFAAILSGLEPTPYKAPKKPKLKKNETLRYIVMGDDQAPHNNEELHKVTLAFLHDIKPDGIVYVGDGIDYDSLSSHGPDAGNKYMSTVQEGINTMYRLLSERLSAAGSQCVHNHWLDGNHENRLTISVLKNMPKLADLRRAEATPEEPPLLSTRELLRLDSLGVQYAYSDRGAYPYAQVQLTPSLIVKHGWIARKGGGSSAQASIDRLNASIITGHTHRLAASYVTRWNADGAPQVYSTCESGTMADPEGLQYAKYPDWQNGFLVVTIWADGSHHVETVSWRDNTLTFRDQQWS